MLTANEKLRFSRQIMVKQIGEDGQLTLRNSTVLIVGMGGLGNPVAMYLAAAGIGKLIIADGDSVDITNLQRQILFNQHDLEQNKADTAADKLLLNNPDVDIEVVDEMLDAELAHYYVQQADLVIDCCDNIATRYLVNQACIECTVPFIVGAATGFDGQQMTIDPRKPNSACYQCVFPKTEDALVENCQTIGVIGPVLAVIGGTQAIEAIKLLTNVTMQQNRLALYDGLHQNWQYISVKQQQNCPICCRL
ncbi:HesA/MoeB/ThiF family protein [Thalassotalea sediminis]|uniref:HesA/MoeB/ThiF family protein n=1 Tax=Thalassotalea sediminis TaxID=1759089 RepID=UPI002573A926|nr:HesA/MoeB/ThiF family protein [Thalassotalea sediminis]